MNSEYFSILLSFIICFNFLEEKSYTTISIDFVNYFLMKFRLSKNKITQLDISIGFSYNLSASSKIYLL